MRGELSRAAKSFQIELRLANRSKKLRTIQIFTLDLCYCPKLIIFNIFFSQNFSLWIKRQSEHSPLCPDIGAVFLILISYSKCMETIFFQS